jgi:hypothetical protein
MIIQPAPPHFGQTVSVGIGSIINQRAGVRSFDWPRRYLLRRLANFDNRLGCDEELSANHGGSRTNGRRPLRAPFAHSEEVRECLRFAAASVMERELPLPEAV